MQPRTVHLFNQRQEKLRVGGKVVVIFQMDDDVAGGGVFHDAKKRVRAAAEIGWLVVSRSDVSANAGRAQGGGGINPPLVVGDGPLALGTIGGVEAVLPIEGDVNDRRSCLVQCRVEIVQIFRLDGGEMT